MTSFRTCVPFSIILSVVLAMTCIVSATTQRKPKQAESPELLAARENDSLRNDLKWIFGGKDQKGWYLYTLLIQKLIDTKDDPGSPKFARAVSRWQAKSALKPTGIINDETLYAMIAAWQDARLKDRSVAPPDQLLTAPIADFYDPTRATELLQVE